MCATVVFSSPHLAEVPTINWRSEGRKDRTINWKEGKDSLDCGMSIVSQLVLLLGREPFRAGWSLPLMPDCTKSHAVLIQRLSKEAKKA